MPLPLRLADQLGNFGGRCRLPLVLLHISRLFFIFEIMLKERPRDLVPQSGPSGFPRGMLPASYFLILPYFILPSLSSPRRRWHISCNTT